MRAVRILKRLNTMRTQRSVGTRREFIRQTAAGAAAIAASTSFLQSVTGAAEKTSLVAILCDSSDSSLKEPPVIWALEQLQDAFKARGLAATMVEVAPTPGLAANVFKPVDQKPGRTECILVAHSGSPWGSALLNGARTTIAQSPEALGLMRARVGKRSVLLACGSDQRGLVYGLLELADQVRFAETPLSLWKDLEPVIEQPANSVRSVTRCFVSDVEDKAWFNDRSFWERYLAILPCLPRNGSTASA